MTVNPCVLPVTVSLNVNVPDLDFNFVKILVTDSDTYRIGKYAEVASLGIVIIKQANNNNNNMLLI